MLLEKKIKNMPVLIQEETLLLDSEIEQYKSMPGFMQQQIIKLIFWRYSKDIDNYMSLDSDIEFVRTFNDSVFFQDNILKTVVSAYPETSSASRINPVFSEKESYKETHDKYFICAYGLWNVSILKHLEQYIQKTYVKNFVNMIKIASVEMEWYGKFLYLFHPLKFKPQSPIILGIQGFNTNDFTMLRPKENMCSDYCERITHKEAIGIFLQYHVDHRSGYALSDLANSCSCG